MASRPRLPDPVEDKIEEIRRENDYRSQGEAIRHVMREAGYNV